VTSAPGALATLSSVLADSSSGTSARGQIRLLFASIQPMHSIWPSDRIAIAAACCSRRRLACHSCRRVSSQLTTAGSFVTPSVFRRNMLEGVLTNDAHQKYAPLLPRRQPPARRLPFSISTATNKRAASAEIGPLAGTRGAPQGHLKIDCQSISIGRDDRRRPARRSVIRFRSPRTSNRAKGCDDPDAHQSATWSVGRERSGRTLTPIDVPTRNVNQRRRRPTPPSGSQPGGA